MIMFMVVVRESIIVKNLIGPGAVVLHQDISCVLLGSYPDVRWSRFNTTQPSGSSASCS